MAFVWCPHSCQFLLYLVELDSHTASCSPRFPSGSWDQKHGWLLFCLEMPAWEKAGRSGNPGWECGVAWGPVPPHSCTREGRLSSCNNTATAGCVDFPVSGSITFPFCLLSPLLRSDQRQHWLSEPAGLPFAVWKCPQSTHTTPHTCLLLEL